MDDLERFKNDLGSAWRRLCRARANVVAAHSDETRLIGENALIAARQRHEQFRNVPGVMWAELDPVVGVRAAERSLSPDLLAARYQAGVALHELEGRTYDSPALKQIFAEVVPAAEKAERLCEYCGWSTLDILRCTHCGRFLDEPYKE